VKRLLLCCLAALGLLSAPATAKIITKATVCGASGCKTVTDKAALAGIEDGGPPTTPPKAAAPFYRVTLTVAEREDGRGPQHTFRNAYVPSLNLLRTDGANPGGSNVWLTAGNSGEVYERLARGLEPLPAARLGQIESAVLPRAQVVEVFSPASKAAASSDGGGFPWTAILLALGGAGVLAVTARLIVARRRSPSAVPAGSGPGTP
jgi:hypothetical protein